MMKKFTEAGWKQADTKDNVNEEEIKALFDMIDKDKSGSLSMRVGICLPYYPIFYLKYSYSLHQVTMPGS